MGSFQYKCHHRFTWPSFAAQLPLQLAVVEIQKVRRERAALRNATDEGVALARSLEHRRRRHEGHRAKQLLQAHADRLTNFRKFYVNNFFPLISGMKECTFKEEDWAVLGRLLWFEHHSHAKSINGELQIFF